MFHRTFDHRHSHVCRSIPSPALSVHPSLSHSAPPLSYTPSFYSPLSSLHSLITPSRSLLTPSHSLLTPSTLCSGLFIFGSLPSLFSLSCDSCLSLSLCFTPLPPSVRAAGVECVPVSSSEPIPVRRQGPGGSAAELLRAEKRLR